MKTVASSRYPPAAILNVAAMYLTAGVTWRCGSICVLVGFDIWVDAESHGGVRVRQAQRRVQCAHNRQTSERSRSVTDLEVYAAAVISDTEVNRQVPNPL